MENDLCRHWFAAECVHSTYAGQREVSTLSGVEIVTSWSQNEFCMPPLKLLPPDTSFTQSGSIDAWWSRSGHIVVRPKLNETENVYMILDTGWAQLPLPFSRLRLPFFWHILYSYFLPHHLIALQGEAVVLGKGKICSTRQMCHWMYFAVLAITTGNLSLPETCDPS